MFVWYIFWRFSRELHEYVYILCLDYGVKTAIQYTWQGLFLKLVAHALKHNIGYGFNADPDPVF
jgi:hypothetical protein